MPVIPFSDTKVKSIAAPPARIEYYDRTFPNFGMRVTPNGVKSFFVKYRVNRKQRRMTLGKYPRVSLSKARAAARDAIEKVSVGLDPMTHKAATVARTFDALGSLYIEKHAKPNKRTWRDDARMIRKELAGWKLRQVESIRRSEVRELLEAIVERGGGVGANRVLALVRKVFNFGIDREWLETNPAHRMKAPVPETSRDRVLSDAEILAAWTFFRAPVVDDSLSDVDRRCLALARAAYVFRLITAQRGTEVLSLRWTDIEHGWWTIPATVAKNKLAHRVPLTPLALAELERLKSGIAGKTFVFRGVRGTRQRRGSLEGLGIEDFQPRDFRRTAASRMAGAGVDRLVVSKILNHVETGITAVYDRHGYDAEKRAALNVWDAALTAIVNK